MVGSPLDLVLLGLGTGTVTVTVTRASVFQPLRMWVKGHWPWFGKLLSCTYCFSHWVAAAAVLAFVRPVSPELYVLLWLVVTALATPVIAVIYHTAKSIGPAAEDQHDDGDDEHP